MIKNAKSLMDKARNLAIKNNISANEVLQNYMFERILERLSISKYKYNFILKGGLLLSSIMGIDTRTTMDMDTCIKGITLTDEKLYLILKEILDIDINDNIKFEIKNSKPIRETDDYGGLKYNLVAIFENIRVNLSIDIATGDLITPREIEYNYKTIFDDRNLKIMTYNIETILAEKYQAIISRSTVNGRMKDYYDIYYLTKKQKYEMETLKLAIKNTFLKRQTDLNSVEKILSNIKESDFLKNLWKMYSQKHTYAHDIKFEEIIEQLYFIFDNCI